MAPKKVRDPSEITFVNVTNGEIYRQVLDIKSRLDRIDSRHRSSLLWLKGGIVVLFGIVAFIADKLWRG